MDQENPQNSMSGIQGESFVMVVESALAGISSEGEAGILSEGEMVGLSRQDSTMCLGVGLVCPEEDFSSQFDQDHLGASRLAPLAL